MVGRQQPERGEARRGARHQHAAHPERGGLGGRVHRAHAAERDEVEPARVGARERQHAPHRVGHVGVDDRRDRRRGGLGVEAELLAELRQRVARTVGVEREAPAPEPGRVEATEHEVGVGDRRSVPPRP